MGKQIKRLVQHVQAENDFFNLFLKVFIAYQNIEGGRKKAYTAVISTMCSGR